MTQAPLGIPQRLGGHRKNAFQQSVFSVVQWL